MGNGHTKREAPAAPAAPIRLSPAAAAVLQRIRTECPITETPAATWELPEQVLPHGPHHPEWKLVREILEDHVLVCCKVKRAVLGGGVHYVDLCTPNLTTSPISSLLKPFPGVDTMMRDLTWLAPFLGCVVSDPLVLGRAFGQLHELGEFLTGGIPTYVVVVPQHAGMPDDETHVALLANSEHLAAHCHLRFRYKLVFERTDAQRHRLARGDRLSPEDMVALSSLGIRSFPGLPGDILTAYF